MDNSGKKLFKTTLVGGFSKEDVSEYIADLINRHNTKLQEVNEELSRTANEKIALSEDLEEERGKNNELMAQLNELSSVCEQNASLSEQIDALNAECNDLKNQLTDNKQVCDELRSELNSANSKLNKLSAMESEYRQNKSRIADLELSAIARASQREQEIEDQLLKLEDSSRKRIDDAKSELLQYKNTTYNQVDEFLKATHASYISLKSEIDALSTHLFRMMDTAKNGSLRVSTACERASSILEGLRSKNTTMSQNDTDFILKTEEENSQ